MIRRTLVVLLTCTLVACATVQTTAPGAIGVQRKQRMMVSEAAVEQAAAQSYQQELQAGRSKGALNKDQALLRRVRGISQRLIPVTSVFRPDAPGWNWEINTLETKDLNAYAMPGGKIMVYSGLVDRLKLTDDELAAVIGHEIGHALREHSRERVSQAYAQQIALQGLAVLTGAGQGAVDLAAQVANVTFALPHSREQETEADLVGLELMARAGYDPHAAVSVWKKMLATDQESPPQFLSTHPSPKTRIADLERLVPRVLPFYQQASRG